MLNEKHEKNRTLINGTIIYAIGTFGTKLLSLLIVPLYTYYISTKDMGVYDLLATTMGVLTPILTLQISDAAYRWMVRNERVQDCIRATYRIVLFGSLIFLGVISIVNLFFPIPYCWYFSFALIAARFLESTQKLLRGLKNQKLFAFSSIIYATVFLLLNVLFIVCLKYGVESLFVSQIIACIIAILFIFSIERRIRFPIKYKNDFPFYKELISYSAPLVPNILNWWIMSASDRYVIRFFLGSSFNGIYAISYKFPTILQQVLALFNNSWQDLTVSEKDRDEQYYSNVFKVFYRFSLTIIPLVEIVAKLFILKIMSQSYHAAANYVGFLLLGTVFQSFSSFLGVGYLKDKNTKQASLTSVYGAVINLLVNIFLIKWLGLHAAAISTFCGFFIMFIIRYFQTKKSLGISVSWIEFFSFLLIDIVFVIAYTSIDSTVVLLLSIALFFLYFIVINIYFIKRIIQMIGNKIKKRKCG